MPVTGDEIKTARLQAGLTLKAVAALYDFHAPATAWQWENEGWKRGIGREPPSDLIARIQNAALTDDNSATHDVAGEAEEDDVEVKDDDVPTFGAWLRVEREARKFSIDTLASRANVTSAQIRNIENGITINPQRVTKDKLEKALSPIPFDVEAKADRIQQIDGLGSLVGFSPHSMEDLPAVPGVYVLYDISERPVYVGKSKNIARRIKNHSDRFWFKEPIIQTASYIQVSDQTLRHQLEQVLIKFLKSNAVLNIQSVERNRSETSRQNAATSDRD